MCEGITAGVRRFLIVTGVCRILILTGVHRVFIIAIAALSVSGCVSDRTTPAGPVGVGELPAMLLTDNPIIKTAYASRWDDSLPADEGEYAIKFPDSVLADFAEIDDVTIVVYGVPQHGPPEFELYDYSRGEWWPVPTLVDHDLCPSIQLGPRLALSAFSDNPAATFLGDNGILRLRGNINSFYVRVIDLRPDYVPMTVEEQFTITISDNAGGLQWGSVWPQCKGIAVVEDEIWVIVSHPGFCDGFEYSDLINWLYIMDRSGATLDRVRLGSRPIKDIAVHEGAVWALIAGTRLGTISRDGTVTDHFDLDNPDGNVGWYRSIVSAMGRLFLTYGDNNLLGVLTDESLDSGRVIADWPLSLGGVRWAFLGVTWDGESFYVYGIRELSRHNLSYQETGRWRMHIDAGEAGLEGPPFTRAIAWDGETFWKAHYGPVGHATQGLMLSRFKLPEDAR